MKTIVVLGIASAFLGGAALALLVSYLFPAHSLYVCLWALVIGLKASLLGAWSVALYAAKRECVRAERIIDLTVDRMLKRRGLEVVDD